MLVEAPPDLGTTVRPGWGPTTTSTTAKDLRTEARATQIQSDEETHLRALNVLCTIYPETPEQIDALATALSELPGVRD
jgi:hypothetical protein